LHDEFASERLRQAVVVPGLIGGRGHNACNRTSVVSTVERQAALSRSRQPSSARAMRDVVEPLRAVDAEQVPALAGRPPVPDALRVMTDLSRAGRG
jgi:hypothetical protein